MALWMVRAGKYGEDEQACITGNFVSIGWIEMSDFGHCKTRDDLRAFYEKTYPEAKKPTVANEVGQLWAFLDRIQIGDWVALPLKNSAAIAVGEITGKFQFVPGVARNKFRRSVKWLRTDIPRTAFDQDLLYSLGAFMTVCQIQRNDAENRIKAIVTGKHVPVAPTVAPTVDDIPEKNPNVEEMATDQITAFLDAKFTGHDLARLMEAILRAQGYVTKLSPPGPDGGVDILAGTGPLGFEHPRIAVQVKSGKTPADVTVLRNLAGILKSFNADQGLLVSWGGFNSKVQAEARHDFFTLRLWDASDVFKALTANYEKLPAEIQAELPLKQIWCLVKEDED